MRMYPEDYTNSFKIVFAVCLNVLMRINIAFKAYSVSILLAHTTTRMRLDPCGFSGGEYKEIFKFKTLFVFFLVFLAVGMSFDAYSFFTLKTVSNDLLTSFWVFYYIGATIDFVFVIYILLNS